MPRDVTPAIVRTFGDKDRDAEVLNTPRDTVSFRRGWGDTGYRIETVEHDCPYCSFDRMVRRHNVSPERQDEVRYWCLNPNCAHFVSDSVSHACHGSYPQRSMDKPTEFEESA